MVSLPALALLAPVLGLSLSTLARDWALSSLGYGVVSLGLWVGLLYLGLSYKRTLAARLWRVWAAFGIGVAISLGLLSFFLCLHRRHGGGVLGRPLGWLPGRRTRGPRGPESGGPVPSGPRGGLPAAHGGALPPRCRAFPESRFAGSDLDLRTHGPGPQAPTLQPSEQAPGNGLETGQAGAQDISVRQEIAEVRPRGHPSSYAGTTGTHTVHGPG